MSGPLFIEKKGSHANDYRSGIRSAIRGLWSGAIDRAQFLDVMGGVIERGLGFAFAEGAKDCGIEPGDYTEAETKTLQDAIVSEFEHTAGLADAVEAGNKKAGGKLDTLNQRAEAWIIRYQDVSNRARVTACADQKYEWVYGPTEHCGTCSRLNGKVKRGSFWRDHVLPQNPPNDKLSCGGWRCQCQLKQTGARVSPGGLGSLP